MPRPVKKRTGRSYARDVETLVRLRTAIVLDPSIPEGTIDKATAEIDAVIKRIRGLTAKVSKVA